jgi:hypothetical protein
MSGDRKPPETRRCTRESLVAFYTTHDPGKLANVDKILK